MADSCTTYEYFIPFYCGIISIVWLDHQAVDIWLLYGDKNNE